MVTMQTTRGGMNATQILFFFLTNSVISNTRSTTQAAICMFLDVDLQSRRLFQLICVTIFILIALGSTISVAQICQICDFLKLVPPQDVSV